MPDSNGTEQPTETVSKQADGYDAENHSGWIQRQIVEQRLSGENLARGDGVRCRVGSDGTDSMLLQSPGSRVDETQRFQPSAFPRGKLV